MAVLSSLKVDGLGQVKLTDDDTRTEVKVVADDLNELLRGLLRGAVGVDVERQGLGNTNSVGELDKGTASKSGGDERLGNPAANVGSGAVDLGVVLSGESTTTVGTPTTVGVDNDLTASKTSITLGTANDEAARGLDVVDGAVVKELSRDDLLDDLLLDDSAELLGGHIIAVLGRDDNGVHTQGLDGTVVMSILNGDLGLGVGTEPRDGAVVAGSGHGSVQLVGEDEGEGKEFRGLVGGITEHDTLVTSTELLKRLFVVETLSNIGRLLLNGNQDVAGLVVKTFLGVIVTNVLDGTTDDGLVIESGLGGDLTENHNHTCRNQQGARLCGQARLDNIPVLVAVSQATLERGSSARQADFSVSIYSFYLSEVLVDVPSRMASEIWSAILSG